MRNYRHLGKSERGVLAGHWMHTKVNYVDRVDEHGLMKLCMCIIESAMV